MANKCTRPKRKTTAKRNTDSFANLPIKVMQSESFRQLSLPAKALLMEFAFRFNGSNNGDLSMAFSSVRHWGFGGERRLVNAIEELSANELIFRTRRGRGGCGGGMPHLYALTWLRVNDIKGKPEIKSGPAIRTCFAEAETYVR